MSEKPEQTGSEEASPRKRGKAKLLTIAIPVLLVAVLGGLWFSGIAPKLLGMRPDPNAEQQQARTEAIPAPPVFVELPEMVANLNASGKKVSFVKVKARIEVADAEAAAAVQAAMPRVQDLFQTYLRETRPEELHASDCEALIAPAAR
jgi:flagellar FliL protein